MDQNVILNLPKMLAYKERVQMKNGSCLDGMANQFRDGTINQYIFSPSCLLEGKNW